MQFLNMDYAILTQASGHYGDRESGYRIELNRRGVFVP